MNGEAFLDTNIFVYAVTPSDRRSRAALAAVGRGGRISVQILNEFANVARRKLRRTWPEIQDALAVIRSAFPDPLPLTTATHERALAIAGEHGVSFYDALIVASALEGRCAVLLTEDFKDGRSFAGRLTVHNPFPAS